MVSHDLPMDQVKPLSSSGAKTGSQVSHSQTKIKASLCFVYFLCIFFCFVISAGLYCKQQKPTLTDLAKKRKRIFTEKLKNLSQKAREYHVSGQEQNKGMLLGSNVRMVNMYFKMGHSWML